MTFNQFISICEKRFNLIYKGEKNKEHIFWHEDEEQDKTKIKVLDLDTLLKGIKIDKINGETEIYNDNYYEIPVKESISHKIPPKTIDEANDVVYSINKPSDKYLIFYLNKIKDIAPEKLAPPKVKRVYPRAMDDILSDNPRLAPRKTHKNLLSEIKLQSPANFNTLVVKTKSKKRLDKLENLAYSFLFHLSYNLNESILPIKLFSGIIPPRIVFRFNLNQKNDKELIGYPKRKYNNDLVLYYQRATSSQNIDNKFLAFYHIIENFFEQVYQEEIIDSVKSEITKPNFSHKRDKDINQLIKVIKKKLIYRRETFVHSEKEALILTIKKFIPELEAIEYQLQEIDPELIEYYKTHDVTFSISKNSPQKIDFKNLNDNKVVKNIANRIYDTRNAVVHSKDSGFLKYLPFKNDNELSTEIPLIRTIAEIIIIKSSTEL